MTSNSCPMRPTPATDAFMKVGPASYLILNHTVKTMNEIRADAKWLEVQPALFDLSEKFRASPLEN